MVETVTKVVVEVSFVPKREEILNRIFNSIKQGFSWHRFMTFRGVEHFIAAEALIELLESFDCGSIGGGFDPEQPKTKGGRITLGSRLDWLATKHKSYSSKKLEFTRDELLDLDKRMRAYSDGKDV